jgi:hypothetical protein
LTGWCKRARKKSYNRSRLLLRSAITWGAAMGAIVPREFFDSRRLTTFLLVENYGQAT